MISVRRNFKIVAALLLMSAVNNYQSRRDGNLKRRTGLLVKVIYCTIKGIIRNLAYSLEVPPIAMNFSNVQDGSFLSGRLNMNNISLYGLRKTVPTSIRTNFKKKTVNVTLKVPVLVITFCYSANIIMGNLIPFYGQSDEHSTVVFTNFEFTFFGKGVLLDKKFKNVQAKLSFESVTFEVKGALDNPEFSAVMSNALDDNFKELTTLYSESISQLISPMVQDYVNSVLNPPVAA